MIEQIEQYAEIFHNYLFFVFLKYTFWFTEFIHSQSMASLPFFNMLYAICNKKL